MKSVSTVQARAVEKIIKLAATYGVSAGSLYASVGLDPHILEDPDQRIPFAQLVSLYEQAAALTGDPAFGLHLGARVDPKVFDVLGYVAINSPTLGEALNRVARYHSIWTDGAAIMVENANGAANIFYKYLDPALGKCRQDSEMTLAAVVALGRQVTQSELSPVAVRFEHASPGEIAEHKDIFRAPVKFAAGINELVFDSSMLSLPIVKADPVLCTVLDRQAEQQLRKYPRPDLLIDRVRGMIKNELTGGDPSLRNIANQLGVSERTLQRRLREHDTSYHRLLDQSRSDLARRYVKQPELAICEIAYLLGFSESSAFHRAFKRWTGITPGEYRAC